MPTFEAAVREADETGQPVVEGFALELAAAAPASVKADAAAELAVRFPQQVWTAEERSGGWLVFRAESIPPLGEAWEAVRALGRLPGVASAEPLLVARQPVAQGTDAARHFGLWGKVSDERLRQIRTRSQSRRQWPLAQMRVCDDNGQGGAWAIWKARHPGKLPSDGILVAHPDTGYTRHRRILPFLVTPGRNFVERGAPDALDPLAEGFGNAPGHGTSTASVIAAAGDSALEPWGVAPGAKVLPLRVSSSVIHLSFQNLADAFDEAMARGAHVISMSLGGPLGSKLLADRVRKALDRGIIVISAAGNNAPTVVFPARLPGVLACAASNVLEAPWRFSGLGAEVAITAPGEEVWRERSVLAGGQPGEAPAAPSSGTSYATAQVAGLAALWLSYHGRDALLAHLGNRPELLPFLFRLCLQNSADAGPEFIRNRKGGFGAGLARADELLKEPLPEARKVAELRDKILAGKPDGIVRFPVSSWWIIATLPTLAADGLATLPGEGDEILRAARLEAFLGGEEGLIPPAAGGLDGDDRAELGVLAGGDFLLANAFAKAAQSDRPVVSAAAIRRYLLRAGSRLSDALRAKLEKARELDRKAWNDKHAELSAPAFRLPTAEEEQKKPAYSIALPPTRRLRAFAFDPSLATQSADAAINEITIPVVFERDLEPGPVGDYLEVVDVDPASDCAYAPVDLNHPFLLAQDGLPRSEGNPQFHQQMVYAVAMKTIRHFEEALGRPIFWSPLRAWDWRSGDKERVPFKRDEAGNVLLDANGKESVDESDQFVRRLRLYPHAIREQNAYYSPQKRAILFGYFPAGDGDPGVEYPGGVVFTCLAHDIIAHEVTHAILDGMHVRFIEPTNPDVFAFHEAFADIVALFQRFTYDDLLRDQIARVRGSLDAGTLMTRLALQFGQATGRHQALRDALGHAVLQRRQKGDYSWRDQREKREIKEDGSEPDTLLADAARDLNDEETRRVWKRFQADPSLVAKVMEPHERGSFLVAAVFDAYLRIYESRVVDLKRIATGGTGVLPDGDLHPDLVGRMANEAAKSARHILKMCIRAMDYVPPTDITFGDFLRALITADSDLVPDDDRRYRVAFIEAFRKWGIYPRDVRTLSEESLRWTSDSSLFGDLPAEFGPVRQALANWQPGQPRATVFEEIKGAQAKLWRYLRDLPDGEQKRKLLGGIDTRRSFQVTNLRPARRIGPNGEFLTEMVVEVLQSLDALPSDPAEKRAESERRRQANEERLRRGEIEERTLPLRGGVTLIIGIEQDQYRVRYVVHKRLDSAAREARQKEFLLRAGGEGSSEAAEYSSDGLPEGWLTDDAVREAWGQGRVSHREDMRASSCFCRRKRMKEAKKAPSFAEPFALLHRG